jgi:hypothetical protein
MRNSKKLSSPEVLIDHRKSTVAEGRFVLLSFGSTLTFFAIVEYILFDHLWRDHKLFLISLLVFQAIFGTLVLWYAIINFRSRREFRCQLNTDRLVCSCPIKDAGESFSLRIADIVKIIVWGQGHCHFALCDRAGRRYELPINYGNPVFDIIAEIQRLRPDLPEPEYEWPGG